MIGELFLIALLLCGFLCCRGLYRWRLEQRPLAGGSPAGDSTLSATADELRQRVEVLERIATDRKTALREKFLDLE